MSTKHCREAAGLLASARLTLQVALGYQHAARARDAQIADGLSEMAAAFEPNAERARLAPDGQDETPAIWLSPGIVPGS